MKRTPLTRRTPLRASRTSTLRGDPRAWQSRTRDAARNQPGRAPKSTLPAVGRRGVADRETAAQVRPLVWERDHDPARERQGCQFPHHLEVMARWPCSAPWPDWPPDQPGGRWRPDPRNPGRLVLCHVIPRELAGPLRWDPHNLFVGCDRGNQMAEDDTGAAFQTNRHGHPWDHVFEGKVTP